MYRCNYFSSLDLQGGWRLCKLQNIRPGSPGATTFVPPLRKGRVWVPTEERVATVGAEGEQFQGGDFGFESCLTPFQVWGELTLPATWMLAADFTFPL